MEAQDFRPWNSDDSDFGQLFLNVVVPGIPGVFILLAWILLKLFRDSEVYRGGTTELDVSTPEARAHIATPEPATAVFVTKPDPAPNEIPEGMQGITRVSMSLYPSLQQAASGYLAVSSIALGIVFFLASQTEREKEQFMPLPDAVGFCVLFVSSLLALAFYQREITRTFLEWQRLIALKKLPPRLIVLRVYWFLIAVAIGLRYQSILRHWRGPDVLIRKWHILVLIAETLHVVIGIAGLCLACKSIKPREDPFELIRQAFHIDRLSDIDAHISGKPATPELGANLFKVLTFTWLRRLLKKGKKQLLRSEDMYSLKPNELGVTVYARFERLWREQTAKKVSKWTFWKLVFKFLVPSAVYAASFKIVYDSLTMVDILFLNLLVNYMSDPNGTKQRGVFYAFLMGANALTETALLHQYFHRMLSLGNSLKSCLATAVYNKALVLDQTQWTAEQSEKFGTGKILNLMSSDAQKVGELMDYGNTVWSAPFQITVIAVLLYLQLGVSAFAGIGVMILALPLTTFITRKTRAVVKPMLQVTDRRIKATSEAIQGIKAIKVYAWEDAVSKQIQDIRVEEVKMLRKIQLLQLANRVQVYAIPMIVAIATFGIYAGVLGNELTPAVAFTSLALFNNLRFPLIVLPMVVTNIAEATVAMQRLQEFLLLPELEKRVFLPEEEDKPLVEVKDLRIQFEGESPIIDHISMSIGRGQMVGLVGRTGCGKSLLLSALLNDIKPSSGSVAIRGHVAFCSQTAWIQSGSVRDNILFGRPYDRKHYERVVFACALTADLKILADGDRTQIGERGVNLSGGQKQRIALARAVYRDADVYLFDDVLSAVDAHVEQHIYKHVFLDLLKDKAILLATHRFDCLQSARIIMLKRDGGVDFSDLKAARSSPDFCRLADEVAEEEANAEDEGHQLLVPEFEGEQDDVASISRSLSVARMSREESGQALRPSPSLILRSAGSRHSKDSSIFLEDTGSRIGLVSKDGSRIGSVSKQGSRTGSIIREGSRASRSPVNAIIEDEEMKEGNVKAAVYGTYFQAGGGYIFLSILLLFMICGQGLSTFSGFWLSDWSEQGETMRLAVGLGVYSGVQVGSILIMTVGYYMMTTLAISASRAFHHQLLNRVVHATLAFFESNPIGRLTNRFSKELNRIDERVPHTLYNFTQQVLIVFATMITIAVVLPVLIALLVPVLCIYLWIERLYVAVARQFQRITSVTRSPVFSNFSETLDGVRIIRAFLEGNQFRRIHLRFVDEHFSAQYTYLASNRWLAVRLESLGTLLVFGTSLASVLSKGKLEAALTGLALTHAISITGSLNWVVRMSGEREASIISVERLAEYDADEHCPQEQYASTKELAEHKKEEGKVRFEEVSLRYRPGLPFALKSVSFELRVGEKVGIVGRTGAGKSSLLVCLLRLVEITNGRIYVHNLPIEYQSVQDLRGSVSIIPQDSVLFTGTIRSNLDPFNRYSEGQIWQALERSCLSDYVKEKPDGLNTSVTEGGSNLSVGQRQLLCLARVLLRDTKLLLLDEATSAVDPQTDALIQKAIRTEFSSSTVLTIAHRLKTVLDYDRIIVMADGRIAEQGSPQQLVQDPSSIFHSMYMADKKF